MLLYYNDIGEVLSPHSYDTIVVLLLFLVFSHQHAIGVLLLVLYEYFFNFFFSYYIGFESGVLHDQSSITLPLCFY